MTYLSSAIMILSEYTLSVCSIPEKALAMNRKTERLYGMFQNFAAVERRKRVDGSQCEGRYAKTFITFPNITDIERNFQH